MEVNVWIYALHMRCDGALSAGVLASAEKLFIHKQPLNKLQPHEHLPIRKSSVSRIHIMT